MKGFLPSFDRIAARLAELNSKHAWRSGWTLSTPKLNGVLNN